MADCPKVCTMCSCERNSQTSSSTVAPEGAGTVAFLVEDMACGHCASTIKKAIERELPGTVVTADPTSKRVHVRGSGEHARIEAIVREAGYTPVVPPVG